MPSTKRPTKTFNEEADEDDYSDTGFSRLYKQSHTSVPPSYLIVVVVLWHCYCQLCSCQLCGGERESVRACVCVRACLNLHNPDLEHLLIFEKSTHVPYFLKINTRQGIKGSPRSQLFHRSYSNEYTEYYTVNILTVYLCIFLACYSWKNCVIGWVLMHECVFLSYSWKNCVIGWVLVHERVFLLLTCCLTASSSKSRSSSV